MIYTYTSKEVNVFQHTKFCVLARCSLALFLFLLTLFPVQKVDYNCYFHTDINAHICIVYTVVITTHENNSISSQTFIHFQIHHEIFNSSKLVNFFLCEGGPSLAHSRNINVIGRECLNFDKKLVKV